MITHWGCDLEDIEVGFDCCEYIPTKAEQSFLAGAHRDEYVEISSIHTRTIYSKRQQSIFAPLIIITALVLAS